MPAKIQSAAFAKSVKPTDMVYPLVSVPGGVARQEFQYAEYLMGNSTKINADSVERNA
jgi:hypothetical protein